MSIVAREILDSRGNPTVEVDLRTDKGESIEPVFKRTEQNAILDFKSKGICGMCYLQCKLSSWMNVH